MGNSVNNVVGKVLAKVKKKKQEKNENEELLPVASLSFYNFDTDTAYWKLNKTHVNAIRDSLQRLHLQMMEEVILEFVGPGVCNGDIYPNYISLIHVESIPPKSTTKKVVANLSDISRYRVAMLGAGGVGKSALIVRFVADEFLGEYDPTISDDYHGMCQLDSAEGKEDVPLSIVDTAAHDIQKRPKMMDMYIRQCEIFLLVFSVYSLESFEEMKNIRERIVYCKDTDNYPMIAVGNKCDLRVECQIDRKEVYEWCEDFQIPYIETSAKTGKNVPALFKQAVYEYRAWLKEKQTPVDY